MKTQETVSQYFDRWATDFKRLPNGGSYHMIQTGKMIEDRLPDGGKLEVLDLGIGNGRLESAMAVPNITYTGIDISKKQLDMARREFAKEGITARLMKHDLGRRLPFRDLSFDAVISNAVFHHVKDKEHLLEECYRVLNNEGRLIFFDFYFGVIDQNHVGRVAEISKAHPRIAERFRESIRNEHKFMPEELERTHPAEYHVKPEELMGIMKHSGFVDCELILTPYEKFIGIMGVKNGS